MKHETYLYDSLGNFKEYYTGDMDNLPAIFVLSSFGVHGYYFDKKVYNKSKMKEEAEVQRGLIEKKSKFPIYCFGAYGKYLITPSINILLTDSFYEYNDFKYTKDEPFHPDYFAIPSNGGTYYSPKAFIRKICVGIGANELIPKLLKQITPVQEYFDKNINEWNRTNRKVVNE